MIGPVSVRIPWSNNSESDRLWRGLAVKAAEEGADVKFDVSYVGSNWVLAVDIAPAPPPGKPA